MTSDNTNIMISTTDLESENVTSSLAAEKQTRTSSAQLNASRKYKQTHKPIEIHVRVTNEQRDEIKAHCQKLGVSVSDFIRELVLNAIRKN